MEVLLDTCGWRMVKSLLLFYVFVMRAAADCPSPQGRENIILTDDALLTNDFPEGSKAALECASGYIRKSGSGTVTCTGGQWTEPDLECTKKDCGPPRQLPHMRFEYTDEGTLFGAFVTVLCDKGYNIVGTSYRQCFALGWNGRSKCEVVTCAKPGEVTNGRHSWDSQNNPIYSNVIQYICDDGYVLTGNDSIECTETGKYNSLPPECKAMSCPSPDIPFSILTGDGPPFLLKSIVSYKCEDGYTLQGAAELACEVNGWSFPFPSCIRSENSKDILTTEDTITTTNYSATPPPGQGGNNISKIEDSFLLTEASTTTTAVSPTTHTDKMITTSATSTTSPSIRGKHGDVDTSTGYTPVITSVIITVIVVLIVLLILYRCHQKKKGPPVEPFQSVREHL